MTAEHIMWLIISIIIFGGMALSVFVLRLTLPPHYKERLINLEHRYNERMALIGKGMDPTMADKKNNQSAWNEPLVWGLLLTGIGVGFVIGYIIAINTGWNKSIIMHSLAFLFGGIGLIIHYFYKRNDSKKAA
ncbi:MAG: DUF6249 domain-containing protein [Ferruginibacter sp.]